MSRKTLDNVPKPNIIMQVDPIECPFREFRDNELQVDTWGLGPAAFRILSMYGKSAPAKPSHDTAHQQNVWVDDQTQPLPRSVRHYLNGWIRAEDLAEDRWNAEVVIYDENDGGKMSVAEMQLSHTQVLMRSSFCRRLLSACFILERAENFIVEHQWDNFVCNLLPEGWRPKYHIYSPGLKPGGGQQHKPLLSKNGCYLVRLYYLGAWRCVWVSDQVPVDASDAPLLPFSPLLTHPPAGTKSSTKQISQTVTASTVYLWPLLLCKAVLKLAAPDMNSDEDEIMDCVEDELMPEFDIMHCLTGSLNICYYLPNNEDLWNLIVKEVPVFVWDDDDETQPSTIKSRSTKKPTAKEALVVRRTSMSYIVINSTKDLPPYHLPGITPGHEMSLLISMARDLPLKKPLPEPEVALWKYYRWVDWARRHGLYAAYDCPRTRYLKVNGLLKMSHAPHLLDVHSTESLTRGFIEEHVKSNPPTGKDDDTSRKKDKKTKEQARSAVIAANMAMQAVKEEMREWVQYDQLQILVKNIHVVYYPSMFQYTTAGSSPPIRIVKTPAHRILDVQAPKYAPLYFQIDGPEANRLKISLSTMHPRILLNTGTPVVDYIEPANLVLETFEWFKNTYVPLPKAYVRTRGYESVEIDFLPGRHFCRLWTHSRMHWHLIFISESTIVVGPRDLIQGAAIRECPWASKFLLALGSAFTNWIKVNRSHQNIINSDRDFFRSYLPDLTWDKQVVGYSRGLLHWMFRQALQSLLSKRLTPVEFKNVCNVFRKYFCDPNFGFPEQSPPPRSVREIANLDICDCRTPEIVEAEYLVEEQVEEVDQADEQRSGVDSEIMDKLLLPPEPPNVSQVCELATDELPCSTLKEEREKMIVQHEAATVLQAYWRGTWARRCLNAQITFTPEVTKLVLENAFGNIDVISSLMSEFFILFPGAKYSYSIASALGGVYGLSQHTGISFASTKCKWIPYFQAVFFCHAPVKVHFDVHSSIPHSTMAVYDNDTGKQLPQVFNAHITFDFEPNILGYTVSGYRTVKQFSPVNFEVHWQLTVMSSIDGAFHFCDNEDPCKEMIIPGASKMHIDEIFLPNRRNIVGGMQISVTKHESISFRAAATSPDLEMVATLRLISPNGETEELAKCSGKGEIYWPYLRLESSAIPNKQSICQANLEGKGLTATSARSLIKPVKATKPTSGSKARSDIKIKTFSEPKLYLIEVVCPLGWPLTIAQWKRVDEVRNSQEFTKLEAPQKKAVKEKAPQKQGSAKEKDKGPQILPGHHPQPGDAYVELECAVAVGGGTNVKRDDDRDLEFANARRSWEAKEPGRNQRGAHIRKDFRTEFLVSQPGQPSDSTSAPDETQFEEFEGEEEKKEQPPIPRPTPVTDSSLFEMSLETEEEVCYLTMPEQLRDKFVPLYFLPFSMKEKNDDLSVLVSPNIAEAAKKDRHARIEAAMERMRELQAYNEEWVLGRQRDRCQLLERLFVDAQWPLELLEVFEEKNDAIAKEVLNRTLSATKKKLDAKKQEGKKQEGKKQEDKKKK